MNGKIIEKIQKLLALATSSNEHEAKAAAAKAQEILVAHNLDMQQVEGYHAEYGRIDSEPMRRRHNESKYVHPLLVRFFFVHVFMFRERATRTTRFIMVGERTNVAVAKYVEAFLVSTFPRLWRAYRIDRGAPASSRSAYYRGLSLGIHEQLEAKRRSVEDERGLVLVGDPNLDRAAENLVGRARAFRDRHEGFVDREAAVAGYNTGKSLNISMGIENKSSASGGLIA